MAHIGNVAFSYINNSPLVPGENVETWTVVGLDGFGARRIGKRAEQTTLECVLFSDRATCMNIPNRLSNLMGTIVSVADQHGRAYDMLICSIGQLNISAAIIPGTHTNTMIKIDVTGIITSDGYSIS